MKSTKDNGIGELLTIQELGEKLKISRQTLYNLRKDNLIPFVKIGKVIRFQESEVAKVLNISK